MKLRIRELPSEHPDSPECVYTHRAANGSVLYVGISKVFEHRTRAHATSSEWFGAVASIDIQRVATRADAKRIEKDLIGKIRPPFNRKDNPAKVRRRNWPRASEPSSSLRNRSRAALAAQEASVEQVTAKVMKNAERAGENQAALAGISEQVRAMKTSLRLILAAIDLAKNKGDEPTSDEEIKALVTSVIAS